MKYINDIKRFEADYETIVRETPKGLAWNIDDVEHHIGRDALGRYKRSRTSMYEVLEQITNVPAYNGSVRTAKRLLSARFVINLYETDYYLEKHNKYNTDIKEAKRFKSRYKAQDYLRSFGLDLEKYMIVEEK